MTITSFEFLLTVAIGVLIYYLIPKKTQWVWLLVLSLVFYSFAPAPYTIIYLISAAFIAYICTIIMPRVKRPQIVLSISIILILLMWLVFKGEGLWYPIGVRIWGWEKLADIHLVASLGMGYYSLQVIGYIIDCYWKNIIPQKNPLKLFLFVSYFPQLTTGPISRYSQLESLYEGHRFNYENICMGAQRILWGVYKKIVIAEKLGLIVSGIYSSPDDYYGFFSVIAFVLYPLQLYCDFSGCMDIVIGASELFGIKLSENFNNPLFSKSTQEFWQRWHITLGTWAKDYVLYPLLMSRPMVRLNEYTKGKFGKKRSSFINNMIGMFVLWLIIGTWHGKFRYIVGVCLWFWAVLMLGNLSAPFFSKIIKKAGINTSCFSWRLFQSIRTYFIFAIGAVFFEGGIGGGINVLKDCLKTFCKKGYANPWVLFDRSIFELGVSDIDLNILIISFILLLVVALLRKNHGYARNWIKGQNVLFRWAIWVGLFVIILVYGHYGPEYDSSIFIYQGF